MQYECWLKLLGPGTSTAPTPRYANVTEAEAEAKVIDTGIEDEESGTQMIPSGCTRLQLAWTMMGTAGTKNEMIMHAITETENTAFHILRTVLIIRETLLHIRFRRSILL
jgi:hypothetical protein